jgi:hypothetical protein
MLAQLLLTLAMAQTSPSSGATVAAENQRPGTATLPLNWRKLELRDSGVTGSVTTRVELKTRPGADLQSTLVDVPSPMSPRVAGTRIQELVVASSIRLLAGLGIETEDRLWFNEDDGLPLQLMRLRRGNKPAQKIYRFGRDQVYRLRRQPADSAETGQPAGQWSQISESFYSLPPADAGCPTILESSQLLYTLSSPKQVISEKAVELCVFDRKHVYRVGFRTLGRERVDVDYLQLAASQETRLKDTLDAQHVVLESRPVEDARGDVEPLSFLGLNGEIHLLLSEPGRIPLRVRGQVSGFGMVELELGKLTR